MVQFSQPYKTTGKTIALTIGTSISKIMSLIFNTLLRFFIAFLPKIKHLLISWLQSLSTAILEPRKMKSVTVSTVSPSIWHEVIGLDAMILVFECWVLSQFFHSRFSFSSRGSLVPLHFPPLAWCYLNIWSYWYFSRQSWFHLMIHLAWHFT